MNKDKHIFSNISVEKSLFNFINNEVCIGLNITAANYVFIYTPEWKPSSEDQAVKRAHRIGQSQSVTVYKMYYVDTVEEVMRDRVDLKRNISDSLIKGINETENANLQLSDFLNITPIKN